MPAACQSNSPTAWRIPRHSACLPKLSKAIAGRTGSGAGIGDFLRPRVDPERESGQSVPDVQRFLPGSLFRGASVWRRSSWDRFPANPYMTRRSVVYGLDTILALDREGLPVPAVVRIRGPMQY